MTTLFISDLHLSEQAPATTDAFYRFLDEQARGAHALYILGDFFDAWVGDDDDAPIARDVPQRLKHLADSGVAIYLMHGNRDFLLGEAFANRAGATLLTDPTVIELNGRRTLLMHGDSLCTRDTEYMAIRQQVRQHEWQAQILAQPLAVRRAMAADLRSKSQTMNSSKPEDIMDVTPEAVTDVMAEHDTPLLIHGHTHRPDRHSLTLNGQSAERIVLGDWHSHGWCLRAQNGELTLQSWPINE